MMSLNRIKCIVLNSFMGTGQVHVTDLLLMAAQYVDTLHVIGNFGG